MIRVGQGFDSHAFDDNRPLILGGVQISGSPGLSGHSDADVLGHAIADALLGAAGLGDLGSHFPSSDRWKDASSIEILAQTRVLLEEKGWRVVNVDATVIAEHPKLSPFTDQMSGHIADALSTRPSVISVKATTTDRLGFAGRGEGIAALAVALIERS